MKLVEIVLEDRNLPCRCHKSHGQWYSKLHIDADDQSTSWPQDCHVSHVPIFDGKRFLYYSSKSLFPSGSGQSSVESCMSGLELRCLVYNNEIQIAACKLPYQGCDSFLLAGLHRRPRIYLWRSPEDREGMMKSWLWLLASVMPLESFGLRFKIVAGMTGLIPLPNKSRRCVDRWLEGPRKVVKLRALLS